MSTKLHHGYRLAEGVDVFDFTDRLRVVMNPIRERLDAALLINAAIAAIDRADFRGEPRPEMPLFDAMTAFDTEQRQMDPARRGHDPHRFELSIGRDPLPDGTPGRVMMLLYADQDAYVEAFEAMPEVEPYGYWNNTDAPDDVTDAEWEGRRCAWDRMVGFRAPVETMMSFALTPPPPHNSGMVELVMATGNGDLRNERRIELMRSLAKPTRNRARALALDLLLATVRETVNATASATEAEAFTGSDALSFVSHLFFTRPDDADNFEAVIDAIEAALPVGEASALAWALSLPGNDRQPATFPLDLDAAHAAARAWVARNRPTPSTVTAGGTDV